MRTRHNIIISCALLAASLPSLFSCTRSSSEEGSPVRFRASTHNTPMTKTVYSGAVTGGIERINWVAGDGLTIACVQCDPQVSGYLIAGEITSSGAASSADALSPATGNGLTWGTGSHTFYGVYPSSSASVTAAGVAGGSFPALQGSSSSSTTSAVSSGVTTVSVAPDMSSAYMYASRTVSSPGDEVDLTFSPMFTAFQFTVGGDGTGGDVTLSQVELSSTSCALSGDFSFNIGSAAYTIPSTVTTGTDANNKITYTFPAGTVINTDKLVRFTLLVQPRSNITGNANLSGTAGVISDLTIRFTLGDGITTRALKLKYDSGTYGGNYVDFPGGHKIDVTGLTLPTQLKSWSFTVLDVDAWDGTNPNASVGSPEVVTPDAGCFQELFEGPGVSGPGDGGEYFYRFSTMGDFSVSATQKVRFSPGNLQAVFASAGTDFTWKFADNQWDIVGANAANTSINGNGSVSAAGTVDLFGWSTASTKYGIHNSVSNGTYSGDFVDWGSDADLIATLGMGLRTLTSNEWVYLLNTRSESYRYCMATVNSVTGLVIFPDAYAHPAGVTAPASVNTSAAYTTNSWSGDAWAAMEGKGCVFLPAAGSAREGTLVYDVGSGGTYWSGASSPYDTNNAYCMNFDSSDVLYPGYLSGRLYGYSVRLVQDL